MSDMSLIIDCICTECGHMSTYHHEIGLNLGTKVCRICGAEMRDVYDVAKECVQNMIEDRKEKVAKDD